jgi:hypothetical protein
MDQTFRIRCGQYLFSSLLIGLVLLAWRNETLRSPPFQDQAVGYWTEGSYLARTGFDYYSLLYHENNYMDTVSGPRAYMISIIPSAIACLMRIASDPVSTIVVSRLMSFAIGGFIVYFVWRRLRVQIAWHDALALTVAMATLPAFITQVEIIGMDVPLTAAFLVSSYFLARKQFLLSIIWSFVAFSCKATGQLMALVSISYLILLLLPVSPDASIHRRKYLLYLILNIVLVIVESSLIAWGDTSVKYLAIDPWPAVLKPYYSISALTPDLGMIMVLTLVMIARFLVMDTQSNINSAFYGIDDSILLLVQKLQHHRFWTVCLILVIGLLSSSCIYIYTSRYVFCAIPPTFFLLGTAAFTWKEGVGFLRLLVILLVGWNIWSADKEVFPSLDNYGRASFEEIPGLTARSCAFTERSREYLREHRSTQRAVQVIEEKGGGRPVFAPVVMRFLLSDPRLGHVRHSQNVRDCTVLESMMNEFVELYLRAEGKPDVGSPIFVWYAYSRITLPRFEEGDVLLYEDDIEPILSVYSKDVPESVRRSRQELEDWFLDQTWDETFVVPRLVHRFNFLLQTDRLSRLESELKIAMRIDPESPTLHEMTHAFENVVGRSIRR